MIANDLSTPPAAEGRIDALLVGASFPSEGRERVRALSRVNRLRDVPTMAVLAAAECGRWDLAEIESDPAGWDFPDGSRAYLETVVAEADAELARRARLRHHPLAPAWPDRRAELDELKARVDLPAFVAKYAPVVLKQVGKQYRGRCPLHVGLATDDFAVHPEKQLWWCFGCLRGGDAFAFAQALLDLDFPAAVAFVASDAGVECPANSRSARRVVAVPAKGGRRAG